MEEFKNHYNLVLITLRNHPRKLFYQLEKKGIRRIFDKILVVSGMSCDVKWKLKYNLIKKYGYDKNSVIIGDTETDILAGKKLKIKTIAVLSGMRNEKLLKKTKPDLIVKDITKIKKLLNK